MFYILMFQSQIDSLLVADSNIQCQYFVTRGDNNTPLSTSIAGKILILIFKETLKSRYHIFRRLFMIFYF